MVDLNTILAYSNEAVLEYFGFHHSEILPQDREWLFKDLMAWMWLNAYRESKGKKTYLFGPLLMIDKMWHAFILHTRDYVAFSNQYFGDYFHHDVEPPGLEHQMEEEELSDFLADCFTHLGSEWVKRNFKEALS